jgi:hypothetical protein
MALEALSALPERRGRQAPWDAKERSEPKVNLVHQARQVPLEKPRLEAQVAWDSAAPQAKLLSDLEVILALVDLEDLKVMMVQKEHQAEFLDMVQGVPLVPLVVRANQASTVRLVPRVPVALVVS